jgi:hypothetical protein
MEENGEANSMPQVAGCMSQVLDDMRQIGAAGSYGNCQHLRLVKVTEVTNAPGVRF